MKFFLDTASIKEIKIWKKFGLVDGVTTNPSLLSESKKLELKATNLAKDLGIDFIGSMETLNPELLARIIDRWTVDRSGVLRSRTGNSIESWFLR